MSSNRVLEMVSNNDEEVERSNESECASACESASPAVNVGVGATKERR